MSLTTAVDAVFVAEVKPEPLAKRRKRVIESDDEEGDECIECESDTECDDEETEEDRAFINDGRVEKSEEDKAAVDAKNIIPEEPTGGRPKRQRKAPTRWEHPDADNVLRKFYDKWGVTTEDLEEIMKEDTEEDAVEPEDDSSFHSSEEEEDDEQDSVPDNEPREDEEEDEEEEEEDIDSEEEETDDDDE